MVCKCGRFVCHEPGRCVSFAELLIKITAFAPVGQPGLRPSAPVRGTRNGGYNEVTKQNHSNLQ